MIRLPRNRTDRPVKHATIPDANPSTHPNLVRPDAHRRGRVQEGVAIGLAIVVLVATFLVAGLTVAGGTVPSASRTVNPVGAAPLAESTDPCPDSIPIVVSSDGIVARDRVCPFGP